jgi:hypothetical protein
MGVSLVLSHPADRLGGGRHRQKGHTVFRKSREKTVEAITPPIKKATDALTFAIGALIVALAFLTAVIMFRGVTA